MVATPSAAALGGEGPLLPKSAARSWLHAHVAGLVVSNNGTDAAHDLDVSAGAILAADQSEVAVLASALTKQMNAPFAEGTGAGGLGDTVSLPTSGTLHVFAITKDADGTVDVFGDTDVSGANAPSGWTVVERIASLPTDGSANLVAVHPRELAGGAVHYLLDVPVRDVAATNPGTSAVLAALSVPSGIQVDAELTVHINASSNFFRLLVTSPDQADTAPGATAYTLHADDNGGSPGESVWGRWRTGDPNQSPDLSGQVRYRLDASGAGDDVYIVTHGWIDDRR